MTNTNRPPVSVVVPFAGDAQGAAAAVELLRGLQTQPGDELILADNCGAVANRPGPVTVIRADGERSPSHARNVGAAHARGEWILFLDADVEAPGDLLASFFAEPIGERVGAITGDIRGIGGDRTLAARYGASRNFLGQRSHVRNQFRPRASSANLLVRRAAFEQARGYVEGIRAAEDTDFTWRLQDLGWTLEFRPGAVVGHEYRSSLRDLRRQWRGYAAGAAWLARRYPGFKPDPGFNRALRLLAKQFGIGPGLAFRADGRTAAGPRRLSRWDRAQFFIIDAILAVEEQIGLRMSNEARRRREGLGGRGGRGRPAPRQRDSRAIRVDLVDPPAYSRPYDHALAAALARGGADVRLLTSHFAFGATPAPDGYTTDERFYRHALGAAGSRLRTVTKSVEHLPDTLRYRAAGAAADVVHFQWLTVPWLDLRLLPDRPVVLTVHDPMARGVLDRLAAPAHLLRTLSAVVVHTEAARRAVVDQGLDPDRVHVLRHGAFTHLAPRAAGAALPSELARGDRPGQRHPIALCFGLIRPYKGIETLLEAWRGVDGAELWIVGRPLFDLTALIATAPPNVRFVPRFVSDSEQAALFDRADLVVLPYSRGARFGFSGVLATALGFGRATVVSDVDGFAEIIELGAARAVPAGDAEALGRVLRELLAEPEARERLAAEARAAAQGPYSWDAVARATLELYERIRRQ